MARKIRRRGGSEKACRGVASSKIGVENGGGVESEKKAISHQINNNNGNIKQWHASQA